MNSEYKSPIKSIVDKIKSFSGAVVCGPALNGSSIEMKSFFSSAKALEEIYLYCGGIAFNGREIFSLYSNFSAELNYSIPLLKERNDFFHTYYNDYELYDPSYIFFGRTDEELLLYNIEKEKFFISAREDLMTFESFDTAEDLLAFLFF